MCQTFLYSEVVYIERYEELKKWRLRVGLKQQYVADSFNLSRGYFSKIESGKRSCSDKLYKSLKEYYAMFNQSEELEGLFDWVRVRIPTQNIQLVIEDIMGLNMDLFYQSPVGRYGYNQRYELGNIIVYNSIKGSDKGVLIELSGKGCRQFEYMLNEQDSDWRAFFSKCTLFDGVPRRIDLAINDYKEYFTIDEAIEKIQKKEYQSKFKTCEVVNGNNLVDHVSKGKTLYLGSKQSLLYFCLYQKNYEQANKLGVSVDEIDVKNRYEIRCKDSKAVRVIEAFLEGQNILEMAKNILSKQLTFYSYNSNGMKFEWKKWTDFLGMVGTIDLSMQVEKPSFERKLKYLENYCSQILKLVSTVGKERGIDYLQQISDEAQLNDRNKSILEQELKDSYDYLSQMSLVNKFTGELKGIDEYLSVVDD